MQIPSGYAQANLKFTGADIPTGAEVTLGFDVSLYGGTPAAAASIVSTSFLAQDLDAVISNSCTLSGVLMKFGPNETGPSAEIATAVVGTGGAAGDGPQMCALVRKTTGFGGRQGQGRFYMPSIPAAGVDVGGLLTTTFAGQYQTRLTNWYNALVAAGLVPTLLRAAGSPIQTPVPITGFLIQSRTATQRRRLRR